MHPLAYIFIAGVVLMALAPFFDLPLIFLLGLALAMTVLYLAALAWLERHPA